MEGYSGIISLFIACLEIVFLINLSIFAEKNSVNKIIIVVILLLFSYQFIEFLMCYTGNYSHILVYFAFVIISFLPPFVLTLVLMIKKFQSRYLLLIFLPAASLLIYYFFLIDSFEITACNLLFAAYEMPLGDLYGVVYYSPIIISIYILSKMVYNPIYIENRINLLIILWGLLITFIPVALIIALFPFLIDYVESFFCKAAIIIAFTLTIYAMRNSSKTIENSDE